MNQLPWFRVYSEILTDRKITRICKKTGQPKALVVGLWTCLLSLANDSPRRGYLLISNDLPYTLVDLEDETGIATIDLEQLLDEFRLLGMIGGETTIEIINWEKRQFKSDDVTMRVRKHRDKQNLAETLRGAIDETFQDSTAETLQERFSNVIDSESDSDSDSESEPDSEPEPEPDTSGAAPAAAHPPQPNIFRLYEREIGPLTPFIADELREAEKEYPPEWISTAFREAAGHNKRSWKYAKAILRRWTAEGYQAFSKARASPSGNASTDSKTRQQLIRERSDAAIRRILEKVENKNGDTS